MYSVLNCHNVSKHTELYLGHLPFNDFKWYCRVFKKELYASIYMVISLAMSVTHRNVQCLNPEKPKNESDIIHRSFPTFRREILPQ
jgi:hypothetical protein